MEKKKAFGDLSDTCKLTRKGRRITRGSPFVESRPGARLLFSPSPRGVRPCCSRRCTTSSMMTGSSTMRRKKIKIKNTNKNSEHQTSRVGKKMSESELACNTRNPEKKKKTPSTATSHRPREHVDKTKPNTRTTSIKVVRQKSNKKRQKTKDKYTTTRLIRTTTKRQTDKTPKDKGRRKQDARTPLHRISQTPRTSETCKHHGRTNIHAHYHANTYTSPPPHQHPKSADTNNHPTIKKPPYLPLLL